MKFPSFIHAIIMALPTLYMGFDEKCVRRPKLCDFQILINNFIRKNYGHSFIAKFFLVVQPSCLKKQVLKPKCAVTDVD